MSHNLKKLRIFAASPSDVASERAKLETVVVSLKPMADYLGLILEMVDWRDIVPDAGRPQQIIFDQLKPTSWDIFIGILWHRFGTPPGATDKMGKEYLSGTEEEFKTAYQLWQQYGKPRMVLYRCVRAIPFDVDPDQLKNVRAFFKLIEDVKGDYPALYQAFDTTESFEKLVLDHLQKLLIEYGEQSKMPITPEVVQVLAPRIPNNLPRRQAFFGRAKEMDIVMRALSPADRTWGVLVDGIGGIGKSAIAIEAAYRAQETGLFNAFVFVTAKQNILEPNGIKELNPPVHTLDEYLNETTRVLGQPGIAKLTGEEKRRALIDALRSMRTLLIYDNLETLSKEEQEGIADFLREMPQGCKAIITSRRRGGEGGVWLRVEKLDWDATLGIIKNQMSHDEGLANKLNRVGETRWQELFDETNGSPLALVHVLGLMRVRATLTFDGAIEMLRGNRDEDLQKFIFQEARKELTENDKTALGALSFFVPSATFEAWMEVAELSRNALETTIDRLSALSLVDVLAGVERYTLHTLTRAFVREELLADVGVAHEMRMRFARYWVGFANQYGWRNYKSYDRLVVETANLSAAVGQLEQMMTQYEEVSKVSAHIMMNDLARALVQFLWFDGRWDERVRLEASAYEAACSLKDWSEAGWRAYGLARVQERRSNIDEATRWTDRCVEAWTRSGGKREEATGMRMRGLVAEQCKDYGAAEKWHRDALMIYRDLKDDEWTATVLNSLAWLESERGQYDDAERYYLEALALAEKIEHKDGQTAYNNNLGELALNRGKWEEAREWFEQGLLLAKEVGRQELIAQAEYGLARVYETEGQANLALPLARESAEIYKRLQHKDLAEVREFVEKLKRAKE